MTRGWSRAATSLLYISRPSSLYVIFSPLSSYLFAFSRSFLWSSSIFRALFIVLALLLAGQSDGLDVISREASPGLLDITR